MSSVVFYALVGSLMAPARSKKQFDATVSFILSAVHLDRPWRTGLSIAALTIGSCVTAELLGYWLHRLLHSGAIRFLSRGHMRHHLVFYGPLQKQRSESYLDATDGSLALSNIGLEWLIPAGLLIVIVMAAFHFLRVRLLYQVLSLGITLAWSFLMFSYLHDEMHVDGFWLAKNKWLKAWFLSARRLHDIHHRALNDRGLMDKNFGIGFFAFDRLFGTLTLHQSPFNHRGYAVALEKFKYLEDHEIRCSDNKST